jgi:hypothetical protein
LILETFPLSLTPEEYHLPSTTKICITIQAYLGYCVTPSNYRLQPQAEQVCPAFFYLETHTYLIPGYYEMHRGFTHVQAVLISLQNQMLQQVTSGIFASGVSFANKLRTRLLNSSPFLSLSVFPVFCQHKWRKMVDTKVFASIQPHPVVSDVHVP